MLPPELIETIEEDHRALDALLRGDAEPKKKMFSHRPDVSLANPLGPPVRGWDKVETTLERVASQVREGQAQRFERISEYAMEGLAYVLEIERCPGIKVGDSEESKPFSLRATTVWRRETDGEDRPSSRRSDNRSAAARVHLRVVGATQPAVLISSRDPRALNG